MGWLRRAWDAEIRAGLGSLDVPLLARGRHKRPREGASLLELVAIYAHEPWGDCPACVDRTLATAARAVNDLTSDWGRRDLISLTPFLAGTGVNDQRVDCAAAIACLQAALPCADADRRRSFTAALDDAFAASAVAPSRKRWRTAARARARMRRLGVEVRKAVAAVAEAEPDVTTRDASLQRLLVDATNAARRVLGLPALETSSFVQVPDRIQVLKHWTTEPGCDWLSLVCVPDGDAEHQRVFGGAKSPEIGGSVGG